MAFANLNHVKSNDSIADDDYSVVLNILLDCCIFEVVKNLKNCFFIPVHVLVGVLLKN